MSLLALKIQLQSYKQN